jgi:hypothetical protein
MWDFFKRNRSVSQEELDFFKSIIEQLPEKYHYLLDQVNEDFLLQKKENALGPKGAFTFVLNADLEPKFKKTISPKLLVLEGIKIWNKQNSIYENMQLHVLEGMLAGFYLLGPFKNYDPQKIEISKLTEKTFNNQAREIVEKVFAKANLEADCLKALDLSDAFEIDISHGIFFTIKNMGDGNYLGINAEGEVFALIHDPYKVVKIFSDCNQISTIVKNGQIDFENLEIIIDKTK